MKNKWSLNKILVILIISLIISSPTGLAVDFLLMEGVPLQLDPRSCQSRFLALALSHADPKNFPITNSQDLLKWEGEIRQLLDKLDPWPNWTS